VCVPTVTQHWTNLPDPIQPGAVPVCVQGVYRLAQVVGSSVSVSTMGVGEIREYDTALFGPGTGHAGEREDQVVACFSLIPCRECRIPGEGVQPPGIVIVKPLRWVGLVTDRGRCEVNLVTTCTAVTGTAFNF